jgi:hypothetical protein
MIDRKYEYRSRFVRSAAPEPPPPEPLRTYKPRRALRTPTKGEVNAAVQRAIRRSTPRVRTAASSSVSLPAPTFTRSMRPGVELRANLCRHVSRLPGDEALVNLGAAFGNYAVDRDALAGPHQHDITGPQRGHRDFADLARSK